MIDQQLQPIEEGVRLPAVGRVGDPFLDPLKKLRAIALIETDLREIKTAPGDIIWRLIRHLRAKGDLRPLQLQLLSRIEGERAGQRGLQLQLLEQRIRMT